MYADRKLKDHIVDDLLTRGFNDFYYTGCNKYAARNLLLSQREQVSGRKDYGQFSLFVDYDRAIELSEYFYGTYGRESIHCFLIQNIDSI